MPNPIRATVRRRRTREAIGEAQPPMLRPWTMKTPEPIARAAKPAYLLLLGILALACFLRFFMLSRIGIRGSDTLYYLTLARGWVALPEGFRGVILRIYALVAALGGESDWSIKALNAGLDVFSVLLAFVISLRISGRRRVALISALSYALLPRAIAFSRTELLHSAATSFFLASFACLIWYLTTGARPIRLVVLGLSGLLIGLGYGVHIDLLPFVPGMVACVLLARLDGSNGPGPAFWLRVRTALAHTSLFLAVALSVMTPLGFWRKLARLGSRLEAAREAGPGAEPGIGLPSISYPELARNMVEFNSSALVAFLFYALQIAALALAAMAHLRRRTGAHARAPLPAPAIGLAGFAPAILIFSHILVYPVMMHYVDPRHFLSALPLVLMSIFVWMDRVMGLALQEGRARTVVYAVAALAVVLVNSWNNPSTSEMNAKLERGRGSLYHLSYAMTVPEDPKDSFDSSKYPISFYRAVYDLLGDRVDDENRLLVAPYVLMSHDGQRRGFRHYFGDDAAYLEDCTTSLEQYIHDRRVRYVVFARFNHVPLDRTPICYGLRKDQYTLKREWALLNSFLVERGDRITLANNDGFFLFELSDARP